MVGRRKLESPTGGQHPRSGGPVRKVYGVVGVAAVAVVVVLIAARSLSDRSIGASPDDARARVAEQGSLFRFASEPPAKASRREAASVSLTASDGTGLKLTSFDSRGVVEGPLAFTEVRLAFDNPESR